MIDRDPDHSILPEAWSWGIVGLNIQLTPNDQTEPYLDLTLRRGPEERRLRFWSPPTTDRCDPVVQLSLARLDSLAVGLGQSLRALEWLLRPDSDRRRQHQRGDCEQAGAALPHHAWFLLNASHAARCTARHGVPRTPTRRARGRELARV